ncbi:hypothetical protein K190097F3_41580 [Enterocloster clostridioformis]|uniref:doubled motif LPXTG anchor domain-containing protein n=2 Tax=Enterocloster clostridioformis TaxID=1531 RepID=UPI0036F2574C
MEGRKRSGMLKKSVYNMRKRLVAFALAAAMVCTNVGADLNAAYGATSSSESVTFEMTGSQLVTAIEEAIENGNVISPGDLDFTNGDIAKFESLFYGEGKVLEVYPDPDGGSMDAELRVFVRLPEDADDMYMVTGDEEIIFLYVNNGEDTISCSTNITRMENGVEKVKKTKRITVKSFEAAYGDEEINYISKPVEETTATAPEDVNGPGTEETIAPDTTVPTVEGTVDETTTVVPGESESTDAPREEQTTAPEEGSTAPTEGVTETSTEAAATEEATTEEATDAPETTEEKTQEAAEADAPEPEAAEPEAATGEPVASIIRHYAPVVADNEEGNAEEAPKVEEAKEPEAEPEEKTEAVKETEAPTEKETEPVAPAETESTTEAQEGNQEESPAAASDETTAEAGESTDPSETTTEGTTAAPSEGDETTTPETTTDAAETPAATEEVQVGTPSDVTKPEVKPEETVNKASTTDLVGMGYCSTAKVYTTTINQLKALDDFDGYKITYSINPGASARIVDGARGVEEGESLTFGVKNQIGFAVESVTANGEVLEADSIADNEDGSQTAWYTVPEVYEEQEVEVYTVETDIHPAFDAELVMDDGMVIHIVAEEGVLPAGVRATAVRVNDNVETAVQEIISADTKRNVSSVMAYDINLWLGDKLLDAEMWSGSRLVNVTFTGKPIIEQSAEADVVEVVCVETVQDSNKEEKEKAAAQESEIAPEDIVKVETVSDTVDVPGEQTVGEISFEAEHFTIYAVVSGNKQYDSTTIAVGEKLTLYNENNKNTLLNADWSVTSGSDVISFISGSTQKRNSIEIVGLKPGTAMVRAASSWGRNYSYTIIVTDTSGINAEYWITNREVTGSDGQQSKNISSTDLSQYGDNGVPVDEVAPSTGTRENDELIFWHARVLPANYHQTNNAGINRVENGQRIERLRFFNENIQYYTSSGSWKDFAATDQLVFYYLQRTELAKQVEIAVSDWWENSNDNTRKIEYELIDELSGNSMGSSLTSYHDKHPGVSGIYITPNLDNAYSVSKVTVDNVEINWENGFSVGWTKSSQTVTVRIYIKPNEANLQIQYLTEDGQPLTGELESSTLGVLTREGTDFNGYVRNGNLQNTKIEGYYGETYIIYTDLKSVSSLKEYALNYEYSSAAVSDNNTVLKLYYRSVSHEYTVNYYKDSISDRNFLGEVEGTGSVGDTIPADLTLFAPEGYAVPGTRSGAEKISADGGDVVNVVYSKKTNLSYTVNYYKDSIEEGNYLDKVEGTGTFGDAIPADLTKFAPAGYAVPGARSGAENISADGGDVVNVVYSKKTNLSYTVNYYKDSIEEGNYLDKVEGTGTFGDAIPADLTKFAPAGYAVPGTRSGAENISADGGDVVNVVYSRRTDLSYEIHYYRDVIDEAHYLGASEEITNKTFGEGVTLGPTLLNKERPDGYKDGVQTPAGPYIIKEKDNVIDVLYTKKTNLSYTVNYYKDSIEEGNYLDKVEGTGTFGDAIPADLTKFAPAGYAVPGARSGAENISADGGDVVNVVYSRRTDLSYEIHYYRDVIDEAHYLGASEEITNKTFGEGVTLGPTLLNKERPDGYKDGVQTPAGPYIIKEKDNVIDVLYTKKTNLSYTVNYYKDSIEEGNYLDKVEGTGTFGDAIPADLTLFAPAGYAVPGTRSGAENISADGGDVVNVVYSKKTNLSYTVNYYKDSIEEGNYLDKVEGTGTFGDAIPADLTKFAPAGYAVPGTRSGAEKISADGGDVVNVVYSKKTNLSYTVNYYKDSIEEGNYLDKVEGTGTFGDAIPADLTKFAPAGYAVPGARSGAENISADGGDVVNVVYSKKTNLSYTVNYYKDSIEEGNYLDKVEGTGTFGDAIPADLTKFAPAGYAVPGTRSGAENISADGGDVVNVVYSKKTNLSYTVNYYKDSIEEGNYLDKVEGTGTFGDAIPADLTKFAPAGYAVPGARSGAENISADGGDVVNVVYSKKTNLSYTVNYYKDSIEEGNYLDKVEGTGTFGDAIPADLTKFAPAGYAVPGARSGAENISADGGDVVNVVYSKKTNLSYTVNYYKDSIEEGNYLDKVEGTGTFEDAIPADLTKFAPAGYAVPGARSGAEKISADGGDVVNVVYSKDTFKYSVHYFYDEVEDEQALEQGIGEFESQVTTYKVKPRTKYALDYVENLPLTIGTDVSKNVINVYYALDDNEDEIPDKYQILFTYVSAGNGSVDGEIKEVHTFRDDNDNYIKPTPTSPKANITVNADDKYAFDYWTVDGSSKDYHINMDTFKTNTYLENTTFTVYFDKDEIGTNLENPDNPDGIPDKYQVVFEYRSEDTNRGTVYGTVKEVVTRPQNEDGSYNMEAPVYPSANVTVSGIGSYSFNNWTDGSRSYANADEIKAAGFTQSTTFTAQFNYNGGGGGTGGGGGGTSGGTTGNRRYTSTPGGPGFTTITPEDVPLAPLPESPVDVTLIDDGEVPLAPLPKTGQTSMRTTLTMMLSGIFVAVTALSRKRKEEDS